MDLFWQIFWGNLLSGILNTIFFWSSAILVGYMLYRKNKKLWKLIKRLTKYA